MASSDRAPGEHRCGAHAGGAACPAPAGARLEIALRGVVQGVGFRPWAARRARALGLAGTVCNTSAGAEVVLEGPREAIEAWIEALDRRPPPGARIESRALRWRDPWGARGFAIGESRSHPDEIRDRGAEPGRTAIGESRPRDSARTRLPPDVALCAACADELFDPLGRRYRYPFTHCARCGPRASIATALPFDRARTSLADFPPCQACRAEYDDPADRRHHAQTVACPACGPRLSAWDAQGHPVAGDPIERAAEALAAGGIVALKGYGGFHLLADASRPEAVARLRKRKDRPVKPFALLAPDLATARDLVRLSPQDSQLLSGSSRPVLLAPRRSGAPPASAPHPSAPRASAPQVCEEVAPRSGDLGLVLPCAPAHWLLFYAPGCRPSRDGARFRALVFTSANRGGEPTLHDDAVARATLAGLADLVVGHDRRIERPSDDPVFRTSAEGAVPLRLSRATAPRALPLPAGLRAVQPVLALGGDLKCSPALAVEGEVWLAEHVGDLEHAAAADALVSRVDALCRLLGTAPGIVVHDRHPDSVAGQLASRWCAGTPPSSVQHHHAHALACLAEHGELGPALAWVLDGAGFGDDGTVWGGELLRVEGARCVRLAHLETVPLPGGDAAAREPWRMAAVWLDRAFTQGAPALPWHRRRDARRLALLRQMARRGTRSPPTSSAGRLFDAAASLLDLCDAASHEGEAAGALEALAASASPGGAGDPPRPPVPAHASLALSTPPGGLGAPRLPVPAGPGRAVPRALRVADLVAELARGRAAGSDRAVLARRFHERLAQRLAAEAAVHARFQGLRRVVLSGGCFQNRLLLEEVARRLRRLGLEPRLHARIPPNDAGLAVGQAVAVVAGPVAPSPGGPS